MIFAFVILWALGYYMLLEISYNQTGRAKYFMLLMWPLVSIWYLGKRISYGTVGRR